MESQTKYKEFWKTKRCDDMKDFVGEIYRRNYRGIQTGISIQWRVYFTGLIANGIIDKIF
jgi:hypothetical protein